MWGANISGSPSLHSVQASYRVMAASGENTEERQSLMVLPPSGWWPGKSNDVGYATLTEDGEALSLEFPWSDHILDPIRLWKYVECQKVEEKKKLKAHLTSTFHQGNPAMIAMAKKRESMGIAPTSHRPPTYKTTVHLDKKCSMIVPLHNGGDATPEVRPRV